MVLLDHRAVVHAQLVRQLRHRHHDAVGTLRRTVALIRACGRRVGVKDLQIIRHVVHGKERQRLGAAVHRNGQAVVAERAGVGADLHKERGDRAVLLAAHLHLHAHGVTGGVGVELLGAGVAVVDGLAGDPCGVAGQVLHQNVLLAAVAAADALLDDMDLIFGNTAHPADDAAHMVRHLRGTVEHQTPALDVRIADVRLERRVLDLAGLVGALHNGVRLGEALFHIADAALVGGRDVLMDVRAQRELVDDLALALVARELIVLREVRGRARVVDDLAVVDERRALRHGLLDRVDRALRLILDLDERGGLIGDLRRAGDDARDAVARAGDDARDAVADVADLPVEESAVVRGRLGIALTRLHIVRLRRIVRGKDGGDAGQLFRLARVDGLDVGAGKGAAEDVQAPGVLGHLVLDKHRLAGDQRRAVDLAAGLADDLKAGAEGRGDLAAKFAEVAQLGHNNAHSPRRG